MHQVSKRAGERPDGKIDAVVGQAGGQEVSPAGDGGLANLLRSQSPEEERRCAAVRRAPLAPAVQIVGSAQPQPFQELLVRSAAGAGRIERATEGNLVDRFGHLVEPTPLAAAEAWQGIEEAADTGSRCVGGWQADGEVQPQDCCLARTRTLLQPG